MSITLKQLYEQTKVKYHLRIIAGKNKLSNTVSRLYYIDDINVADWTRSGELIITTGSPSGDNEWLHELISNIINHNPSGIVVNIGGYIKEIPQSIIEYCNYNGLPLLTFPWNIFLQDVIQDWTNRIFKSEQSENDLSFALLNAIYEPEDHNGYVPYLSQNGYNEINDFVVAVIKMTYRGDDKPFKYKKSYLNRYTKISSLITAATNSCCILLEDIILIVFFRQKTDEIEKLLNNHLSKFREIFAGIHFRIGIGNSVPEYKLLSNSYKQALLCANYKINASTIISSINSLGIAGLLITCDQTALTQYHELHLKDLKEYDSKNGTDYCLTLKSFIQNSCNVNDTANDLFIHRNTVNYRIKRIQELLNISFNNSATVTEYNIAFMIDEILTLNELA